MRKSIATVSVSGTLPEKLAAIAQARFQGVEIFESDLVAAPFPAGRIRGQAPTSAWRSSCTSRSATSRRCPRPLRGEPQAGRAQVRRHGAAGRGHHAGVLQRLPGRDRRRRPGRRAPARPGRAGRGPRHDDRLRGAGLGPACQRLPALMGDRPGGRPPGARRVPGQLPYPLARPGPGGDPPDPRRQDLLPAAGRRAGTGDGRAAVVPALPLLPRPGRLRPARLPGARTGGGIWRPAVAGGIQRHFPAGRTGIHRGRCHAVAAVPGGIAPGTAGGARRGRHPGVGARPGAGESGPARAGALPLFAPPPAPVLAQPAVAPRAGQQAPPRPGLAFAEIAAAAADGPALADTLRTLGFTRPACTGPRMRRCGGTAGRTSS